MSQTIPRVNTEFYFDSMLQYVVVLLESRRYRFEAATMMNRDAASVEAFLVCFRAVTSVSFPTISRVFCGEVGHDPIARYFGDY